ncbi:MAG TPA: hypothetical protein VFJ58_01735 [Armatimonadota bacterium]|nr:hypothetical protein [Armatimonadota bacterium]
MTDAYVSPITNLTMVCAWTMGSNVSTTRADAPPLYKLDADIGEATDMAAQHPEVVKRLQALVEAMDADPGKRGRGPGVRPPVASRTLNR